MVASFHEVRFPELVSWGATGGAEFNTSVVIFRTGKEQRNQNWFDSRLSWDVTSGVKKQEELDELIDFFRARRGRAYGFRFKDWSDYRIVDESLQNSADDTFVGDGTTTVFNVVKTYEDVSGPPAATTINPEIRRLYKLRGGPGDPLTILTEQVKLDGVLQGSGFTIDRNVGTVTFSVAPGVSVVPSLTTEFDVPARFDVDRMAISIEDFNANTWGGVTVRGINPLLEPV